MILVSAGISCMRLYPDAWYDQPHLVFHSSDGTVNHGWQTCHLLYMEEMMKAGSLLMAMIWIFSPSASINESWARHLAARSSSCFMAAASSFFTAAGMDDLGAAPVDEDDADEDRVVAMAPVIVRRRFSLNSAVRA